MKTVPNPILSLLLLMAALLSALSPVSAQPLCGRLNTLVVNTGYDPVSAGPIPIGVIDPYWTITAMSPDAQANCSSCGGTGSTPPFHAFAEPLFSGGGPYVWTPSPLGQWIGFQTSTGWGYPTNGAGTYDMTLSRSFTLCDADNIHFDFMVASDNYISSIDIDNTFVIFSQPPTNSPTNYNSFIPVAATLALGGGLHTINVHVVNYPEPQCDNRHALNLVGNVNSPGNFLVDPLSPPGCVCSTTGTGTPMPCNATVSLDAVFSATLMPNRDCEFLCTANTTPGSGWTPVSYTFTTTPVPPSYGGLSITSTSPSTTVWTPNGSGGVIVTVTVTFTNAAGEPCTASASRRLDCNGGNGFVFREAPQAGNGGTTAGGDGGIVLFPNPTNGTVTISTTTGTVDHVVVMDISGRKLAEHRYSGSHKVTFSLEKFPPGTYTIRVNDRESKLVNKTN